MGIYIKGMGMPTACRHGECNFACSAAYQTGLICIIRKQYVVPGNVPGDCPCSLIPPHGRLIDADAVERNLVKMQMSQKGVVGHGIRKLRAVVRDMATVIPADDKE